MFNSTTQYSNFGSFYETTVPYAIKPFISWQWQL